MGNDRRLWWVATLICGLLAGLSLPPHGWPWLLWPSLLPLWALAGLPPRGPADGVLRLAGGLVWGGAAVLVSHRWLLWLHPLDWIGVPSLLSLPLCIVLWLLCGLWGGLLVSLWLVVARRLGVVHPAGAVAAATLWGLAEVVLSGGPLFWIGLGSSALPGDRALAGLAAIGGASAIAALQLLIGWCLWRALVVVQGRRGWLLLAAVLVGGGHLVGGLALGGWPLGVPPLGGSGQVAGSAERPWAERLLVVQPAIPTRHKFEVEQQQRLLRQLAAAQRQSDPATAPGLVSSLLLPEGALALGQPLPVAAGVEVLSGGFRWQGEELRSSLLRFAPGERQPSAWVDKHRLVLLGEWVPRARWLRWSGLSAVGGIEPGPPSRLLQRPAGPIGVAICYEISDGQALAAATRAGARWLLASANLDPYPLLLQHQFLALGQLRAIETGRWLVSSANTGPSLLLDERGRLRSQLPPGLRTSGLMRVEPRSALTPYVRWGEAPLLMVLVAATAVRAVGAVRPRR